MLRECWTEEDASELPIATHVAEIRDHLAGLVQENMAQAQARQKQYYDRGTKDRILREGDQVLALLPAATNKLMLEWVGPYKVLHQVTPVDYEVSTPGRRQERKPIT